MPQRPSPTFLPLAFLALTACARDGAGTASSPLPTGATAAYAEEDSQWLMAPGDYANTRYSRLTEINADNVGRLQVAWTFSTGVNRGQEAAPSSWARRCTSSRRTRTSSTHST